MMDNQSIDEMPAGPKLDALIDERVFGYKVKIVPNDDPAWHLDLLHPYPIRALRLDGLVAFPPDWAEQENWVECPAYSWNIAAAWEAAEEIDLFNNNILTKNDDDGKYIVCPLEAVGEWPRYYNGASKSAALAICHAILKAIEGHAARPK